MNDALLQMLGTPLFDPRIRHQLPLRDYMDLTINRMRKIVETGLITNDMWLGQPRQSDSSTPVVGTSGPRQFGK